MHIYIEKTFSKSTMITVFSSESQTDTINLLNSIIRLLYVLEIIMMNQIICVTSKPTRDFEASTSSSPVHTMHYHFEKHIDSFMQLHKLDLSRGNNITCNDGSSAGYYKRLNNDSKTWIIYLQGGGYCGSEETCMQRWQTSPYLMSSNYWPKMKSVDGILSSDPKDNPYLWNANHIYVPYCSSDSWTGSMAEDQSKGRSFAFMGSRIIEDVIDSLFEDLPRESSLYESKFILLAGDSAGATGVILNLDKVNKFVQRKFNSLRANCTLETSNACEPRQAPVVRGLADSGWFLDNEPYDYNLDPSQQHQEQATTFEGSVGEPDCDRQGCTPVQSIKQAMSLWNGQVPRACSGRHANEPWRCYFAYRAYQTLKTPLFVVQWLYDEVQLMANNIGRPHTDSKWNHVNKVANELRTSLENVTALFVPSCISHSLIIKQSWNQINIHGFKLPHILNSWEEMALVNQPTYEDLLVSDVDTQSIPFNTFTVNRDPDRMQAAQSNYDSRPISLANQQTSGPRSRRRKRKRNNQSRLSLNNNRLSRSTVAENSAILLGNNMPDNIIASSPMSRHQELDKFRLIDTCGWPQCNRDCPGSESDYNMRSVLSY